MPCGFVATTADAHNPALYAFLKEVAPPTMNPSLWRQAQLNAINGLFKIADGVYQVRGFSLANMTILEGATGVIVVDPLLTVGSAQEAMARRAQYQFGTPLPRSARANVDAGLGKMDSRGAPGRSLIAPTDTIAEAVETRTIDGVTMVFQLAPASEAPAEMHFYLPQSRVLDIAENATHTLHNLLPLRGTEVRDAKGWSHFLSDALERFGADAQVMVAQHHWPVWGNARVVGRLRLQRDLYKYVHDQTVRMMNQGFAPSEIAETLTQPPGLEHEWSARGYYGTLSHDAKAVYQKYIGWYDGNPATLNALPPADGAKKYVDFKAGRYRWVLEVLNKVVYAEPGNVPARALAADASEQLGYLAESATWRNAYLLGAQELRSGPPRSARRPGVDPDVLKAMPLALVFDYLGTNLNGPRAGTTHTVINWRFTDTREAVSSTIEHAALTYVMGKDAASADATVTLTRAVFEAAIVKQRTLADAVQRGEATVSGSAARVNELMTLFDDVDAGFAIVEPRRPQ